jgi:hypothetical protein
MIRVVGSLLLAASTLLASGADVPVPPSPAPLEAAVPSTPYSDLGHPETVELYEIAEGRCDRRVVRTQGVLSTLEFRGEYYELSDRGRVVLMPVVELESALHQFVGRTVEVVGYVRKLWANQAGCVAVDGTPSNLCTPTSLPVLPDLSGPRATWPRVSLTIWRIADVTRRTASAATGLGEATTMTSAPTGRRVTVRGRFCGASLCGAPSGPRPTRDAWLLADTDVAIWVVGKAARGKGWRLDPGYAGDTARWLEVEGTIERCGPAPCLRARRVELTTGAPSTGEN